MKITKKAYIFAATLLISSSATAMEAVLDARAQPQQDHVQPRWSLEEELRDELRSLGLSGSFGRVIALLLLNPLAALFPAWFNLAICTADVHFVTFKNEFLRCLRPIDGMSFLVRDLQIDREELRYFRAGVRIAGHVAALAAIAGALHLLNSEMEVDMAIALLLLRTFGLLLKDGGRFVVEDFRLAVGAWIWFCLRFSGALCLPPLRGICQNSAGHAFKLEVKIMLSVMLACYTPYRLKCLLQRDTRADYDA